ncbi:sigma-70 family RNA polymerase sigma factor [Limnohabitans sp.]|uniref:sigma-70 family RNA polymerase sigma factor n=1 Tax=Limnohabitans sp. TaxID=1907725 RepID=UPI00286F0F98|nr:sigma-70 family RNA polymerase sigma factor [Limnohabitans sp.]
MSWHQALEQNLRDDREFLLRLAHAQLRNPQEAADAVQDTALAAWQTIDRFEGRSSIRTWLVGILRFKILDVLRERQRHPTLPHDEVEQELQTLDSDLLFDDAGRWTEEPQTWWSVSDNPSDTLQQNQMMRRLQQCLDKLPEKTAHVFLMREYLGFETPEIAQRTGLQAGNIRIILMRARLALRTCLEWQMSHRP